MHMASAPPTSTWPHRRHHTFLRPPLGVALVVLAATVVCPAPASSQPLPSSDSSISSAFSPPSPPMDGAGAGRFTLATSLLFVGLIAALFLLGFFSAFLRRRSGGSNTTRLGAANAAAVSAAAAAAFASSGRTRAAAVGLDAAAMRALPVLTYATARAVTKAGRRGGPLECAVCLCAFDDGGEKLRLLPGCCHVFHAACIDAWLAAHVTCPVCRADLSDPAVADAGLLLAANLAAAHADTPEPTTDTAVITVSMDDGSTTPAAGGAGQHTTSETAEERADRFTLRLPERLRREIDEAKRLRRALSAVTASSTAALPTSRSGGSSASAAAMRTMSAARPMSRRWSSALFRALSSGSRRMMSAEADGHRRVVPLPAESDTGEVEVVVVRERDDVVDKYYAHSLTFAGFVIDGDVAAGDWNPEVFHVSSTGVATSQR